MIPIADFFEAFSSSDFWGKSIILLQLAMSVGALGYAIGHYCNLKRFGERIWEFRRFFSKSRSVFDYQFTHAKSGNPIHEIYFAAMKRLSDGIAATAGFTPGRPSDVEGRTIKKSSFDLVKGAAEEALAAQNQRLEAGMNYLGAIATLAPFLGLLGTVYGVMEAFQDMGKQGSVNLATVAPYLSTAMLTTVVGLVVAIPSVLGYNILARKIAALQIQLDGFTDEYLGRVQSEFCEGGADADGR